MPETDLPQETAIPEGDEFVRQWNALDVKDRRRVRRLVKLGRPLEDAEEAALAIAYGRFQLSRTWMRFFWLWFIPGVVLAIGIATSIHPLLIGVVLALSAQAFATRRNLRRVEQVNRGSKAKRRIAPY